MSLSALPAELTLNIAKFLDPDSTLSFALTCKHYSTLCKDALREHGQRLSEWETLDTTDASILLWQNLKEILDDSSKGWYVRELNLPPDRQYNWNPGESLPPHHPRADMAPSDKEKEMFKKAAKKLEALYPTIKSDHVLARPTFLPDLGRPNDLVGTIGDRIDSGIEDGVVAILLHHLPSLKTIRLTEVDGTSACLELAMHRIAGGYKDPTLARKLPLQHLTTAAVSYCNIEGSIKAEWATSLLSFPSLKTFAANEMGGSPTHATQACYMPTGAAPFSNVTELFFMRCQFDVDGLGVILSGIKNLKKLTYYGGDVNVGYSFYEPRKLIKTIEEHQKHSLEELVLDQEDMDQDDEDINTVSLRNFQKLKIFNCPWYMIRPIPEDSDDDEPLEEGFHRKEDHKDLDTDFDVRTILPESLEELFITGTFFDNDGEYEWRATERVFRAPNTMTPHLTMTKTCIRMRWNQETRECIGTADEPVDAYTDPRHNLFFGGHGFGAF